MIKVTAQPKARSVGMLTLSRSTTVTRAIVVTPWELSGDPPLRPGRVGGSMGRVVLAGTPIGDVGDASPRLAEVLATADVIAAEDTRRLRRLLDRLGVSTGARVVSYFDGNEAARAAELLD